MASRTHAIEVELTEFTARHLWRFLRPLVRSRLSARCHNCILTAAYSPLDDQGLCEICAEHLAATPETDAGSGRSLELEQQLDELLRSQAGAAPGPYDAILLLSGGKDSTYLLHRMVRDYPDLRLLSVLVNNGFMSPFALENAAKILSLFDVPHMTINPKPSFVRKAFHYALTHLDEQKGYSIVDTMDGFITFDAAKNLAAQSGIPMVLCGLGKVQTANVFGPIEVEFPPEKERAPLVEHGGVKLAEVFDGAEMAFWFDGSKWPAERVPRFVLPFTVWDPDEDEVLREVDRLGLISKGRSRPLLTNNALIPVIAMAEIAKFGYCSWEIEFARMIREGKSERPYWLALFEMAEYSAKSGRFVNKTVEETLARLGLTKRDIGICQ